MWPYLTQDTHSALIFKINFVMIMVVVMMFVILRCMASEGSAMNALVRGAMSLPCFPKAYYDDGWPLSFIWMSFCYGNLPYHISPLSSPWCIDRCWNIVVKFHFYSIWLKLWILRTNTMMAKLWIFLKNCDMFIDLSQVSVILIWYRVLS